MEGRQPKKGYENTKLDIYEHINVDLRTYLVLLSLYEYIFSAWTV